MENLRLSLQVIKIFHLNIQIKYIYIRQYDEINDTIKDLIEEIRNLTESVVVDNEGKRQFNVEVLDEDRDEFNRFYDEFSQLKQSPADAIARVKNDTYGEMVDQAKQCRLEYERAGKAYETMSTKASSEYGDKISKGVVASTSWILK